MSSCPLIRAEYVLENEIRLRFGSEFRVANLVVIVTQGRGAFNRNSRFELHLSAESYASRPLLSSPERNCTACTTARFGWPLPLTWSVTSLHPTWLAAESHSLGTRAAELSSCWWSCPTTAGAGETARQDARFINSVGIVACCEGMSGRAIRFSTNSPRYFPTCSANSRPVVSGG